MIILLLIWITRARRHHLRHLRIWHPWHRLHHLLLRHLLHHWLLGHSHHRLLGHRLHHRLHHWLLLHHHSWLRLHHRLHHWLHHWQHHWLLTHHHWLHHSLSHTGSQKVWLLLIDRLNRIIHILRLVSVPQLVLERFKYQRDVNLPSPYIFEYDWIPLINVLLHIYIIELYRALTDCVRAKRVLVQYLKSESSLSDNIEMKRLIPRWLLSTTLMDLGLAFRSSTEHFHIGAHWGKHFCVSCKFGLNHFHRQLSFDSVHLF